jgi:3-methylcrotonyl-CoA carboxylase alpha subunit
MRRFEYVFRGGAEPEEIRLEGEGDTWRLTRKGETQAVSVRRLSDGRVSLLFPDGRQVCGRVFAADAGEVVVVDSEGLRRVPLADPLTDRLSRSLAVGLDSAEEEIRALIPGRVLEVRVTEGDQVRAGEVLIVLEAMKMQNEIRAASGGTVARCAVSPGEAVEGRALLLVVRPSPTP